MNSQQISTAVIRQCDSRNSSEHALEYGEKKVWNLGASHGRHCEDALETKVSQVTDIGARRVGKCQRITPEEPLKADDAN